MRSGSAPLTDINSRSSTDERENGGRVNRRPGGRWWRPRSWNPPVTAAAEGEVGDRGVSYNDGIRGRTVGAGMAAGGPAILAGLRRALGRSDLCLRRDMP